MEASLASLPIERISWAVMRLRTIVYGSLVALATTTSALAWEGGALGESGERALAGGQPAQAVSDLRRAARSILMPDALPAPFKAKLDAAHLAWLLERAQSTEREPIERAVGHILAVRKEATRLRLSGAEQAQLDAAVLRVMDRAWDLAVTPSVKAGDFEAALREARLMQYEFGRPSPREGALVHQVEEMVSKLSGPNAPWLRAKVLAYLENKEEPAPLVPYAGARGTSEVTGSSCAILSAALEQKLQDARKGSNETTLSVHLDDCRVQTVERRIHKALPYQDWVTVQTPTKVQRTRLVEVDVPVKRSETLTQQFSHQYVSTSGSYLTERTSSYDYWTFEKQLVTESYEDWELVSSRHQQWFTEQVDGTEQTVSLAVRASITVKVDGVAYPTKIEIAPSYTEEAYTSKHSASKAFGPKRSADLERSAAQDLFAISVASEERAIRAQRAQALEAEIDSEPEKRMEKLTAIAFYRRSAPQELVAHVASVTGLKPASLERALQGARVTERALRVPLTDGFLTLPAPTPDAEKDVFGEEESTLVNRKLNAGFAGFAFQLGGHSSPGVSPYATLGVRLNWQVVPPLFLLKRVGPEFSLRPEGGIGLNGGMVYYNAPAYLSLVARPGPFTFEAFGTAGVDGRAPFGEGNEALLVRPSGYWGYGGRLGFYFGGPLGEGQGAGLFRHGIYMYAARKHRVQHDLPMANVVELTYGKGISATLHAELWGDIFEGTLKNAPISAWLGVGASFDVGDVQEGDAVAAEEHEK